MVLSNPFPGHTALATFEDVRRDLEGLIARDATGKMRAGIFPDHLNPLVTGRTDMKLNIGAFRGVQDRGGAVLLANVGTDTSVTLVTPVANKRIDLVYVTARSMSAPWSDAASTPIFGVVQGVPSATPAVPSLPANLSSAIVLATVKIPAGATTTLSAGVIISQVYPYTALAGGVVPVRSSTELAAWVPSDGALAYNISDKGLLVRNGSSWDAAAGASFRARKTSGAINDIISPTAIPGLNVAFTLGAARDMTATVSIAGYSNATDTIFSVSLIDNGTTVYSWTYRPNSGGANTGQAWTFVAPLSLAAGSHSFTISIARTTGSGGYFIAPSATANAFTLELSS